MSKKACSSVKNAGNVYMIFKENIFCFWHDCLLVIEYCLIEYMKVIKGSLNKFELNSVIVVYNGSTWQSPTQPNFGKSKLAKMFYSNPKKEKKNLKIYFILWTGLAYPGPALNKLNYKKMLAVTLKTKPKYIFSRPQTNFLYFLKKLIFESDLKN